MAKGNVSATEIQIKSVVKRDGRVEDLRIGKMVESILQASQDQGEAGRKQAIALAHQVLQKLNEKFPERIPTVENIQDLVENALIENGQVETARAYIIYRHKKDEERQQKALILGGGNPEENLLFSNEALTILEKRYLLKDKEGNLIETPKRMLQRVAKAVAQADKNYGASVEEINEAERQFYQIMAELRFLPNSPALMNAGTAIQQLSSCFVLPIEDSMESIFGTLRDAALIHQRGSGTGFSFSRLRPRRDPVNRNLGVASGPVAFLQVYDAALEVIKQGGVRPGANMAVLRVDHPEIIRFIESKREKKSLKNFNISVAVTDRFLKAVEEDGDYFLANPKNGRYTGKLRARDVFSLIIHNAWKTGDPGLVFIDEINRKHPARHLGEIETTNQCGEAPLLPYEGCVLGSINLNKFIDGEKKDLRWEELKETVKTAVHFLDNVIDVNDYPQEKIEMQTKKTRKIGLGIMGLADLFFRLEIKYDSEKGLETAERMISFIKNTAYEESGELARKRGVCPAWESSDHQRQGRRLRNMTCLSIAPTGTISILADASSGCEPLFALSYQKTVLGNSELFYLNKTFEKVVKEKGFYSAELIRKISRTGSLQPLKEIPSEIRDIFVIAQDISPEWHVRMQATLQKHVDNSISKTINFPRSAAIKEVEDAYLLAWKAKCKGITIYRDGSYEDQVMTIGG